MPSPLLQALYERQTERVAEMLAGKPELDIFEAAAVGDETRIRELIEGDHALAEAVADDGFRPLHLAAYFGHPSVVQLLISRGADLDAVAANAIAVRPVHSAIAAQQLAIARMLLDAGANPNVKESGGWTPLHAAAQHGNAQAVELLLAHGADPRATGDDGRTPADMASEIGHHDLAQRLRDAAP